WTFRESGVYLKDCVHEQDGNCYISLTDGRMYAVDAAGNRQWSYDEQSREFSDPLKLATAPTAELYSQNGSMLYGLRTDGELCWTVNPGADPWIEHLHSRMTINGQAAYVINWANMTTAWPDGSVSVPSTELLSEPKPVEHASLAPAPELVQLVGLTEGEVPLLRCEDRFQLMDGKDAQIFTVPIPSTAVRIDKSFCGGNRLLVLFNDSSLAILDLQGRQIAEHAPISSRIDEVKPCDAGFVLMTQDADNIARSLRKLGDSIKPLDSFLFPGKTQYLKSQGFYGYNTDRRLQLVSDERILGSISIPYIGNVRFRLAVSGSRVYISNGDWLDCYVIGAGQ
ncbi:PQQ-like beta-propeller repeat protein, partial [bacterium]|nr:PQQ-like beta-propeller repeat protein [bacterium]